MKNEVKFTRKISFYVFFFGIIVNSVGLLASTGFTKLATFICWLINIVSFLLFCIKLEKYSLYTKTTMLSLGMFLFPTIFLLSTSPETAILYDFILPCIYTISIRKRTDMIVPLFNCVFISVLAFYRLGLEYAIIFFVVYTFSTLLGSLFSISLFDSFKNLEIAYDFITDVAKKDRLTGIYNRYGLEEAVKDMKRAPCHAVMMDIDFFKKVNDTYGHEKGDEILMILGNILKNHSNSSFLVSRWGGEEFLILSFMEYEETLKVLTDIYKCVDEFMRIDDAPVHVSMGMSAKSYFSDELITEADENLYRSKKTGRNKLSFNMKDVVL